jgi:lipopolysaccharide export system permease protein
VTKIAGRVQISVIDAPARRSNREANLKILQKYILREWVWTFLAVTVVLLIVMIGVSLGELLSDVAGGRMPAGLISVLMLLKMPDVLSTIIPLSIFVSVVWGTGRMYRDQEMAVMRASGFNWVMLLRPLFNLLMPVAGVILAMSLFVAPMTAGAVQQQLENAYKSAAEWGLQTGQFHVLRGGDLVLYVESVDKDGRTLRNIFIQQRQDEREQVWIAEKGYYWLDQEAGERYLTLENGQITEGGKKVLDFGIIHFSRNDLRLPVPAHSKKQVKLEARASSEIMFSTHAEEKAEIQWRVSPAIAIVVLGMLAIPLSHSAPREGRGSRVLLGILAYTIYANLLYMCRTWVAKGDLSAMFGLWWVHLLVLIVALAWLKNQGRMTRRR